MLAKQFDRTDEFLQATQFEQFHKVKLKQLPGVPGKSGDYIVVESDNKEYPIDRVIEFKEDKMSVKTGNLYIEFQQTINNSKFLSL